MTSRQKGISFIEINVSIVLFLIVAICIIGMLANCTLWMKRTTELRQCIHLAQWKMAETQYMSEADIREGSDKFPPPFNNYTWQIQKLTPADLRLADFTEIKVTAKGLTGAKVSLVILKKHVSPFGTGAKFFVMSDSAMSAVCCIDINNNFRTITPYDRQIWDFAVSPDASKILVTSSNGGIEVMNIDGTNRCTFKIKDDSANGDITYQSPFKWSPESNKLSFAGSNAIYVLDLEGNLLHTISLGDLTMTYYGHFKGRHSWHKDVNSDEESIVYTDTDKNSDPPETFIYKYNLTTGGANKLYNRQAVVEQPPFGDLHYQLTDPVYSPDGTKIVFTIHSFEPDKGGWRCYAYIGIMDSDGTNIKTSQINFSGVRAFYKALSWNENNSYIFYDIFSTASGSGLTYGVKASEIGSNQTDVFEVAGTHFAGVGRYFSVDYIPGENQMVGYVVPYKVYDYTGSNLPLVTFNSEPSHGQYWNKLPIPNNFPDNIYAPKTGLGCKVQVVK